MKSANSAKSVKNANNGKTSVVYVTVFNPNSRDELERLLATTQRRRGATKITTAARRRAAQKKAAWARVSRIIKKAEAAAPSRSKRKYTPVYMR
jgi:hypothetical protein